MKQQTAEQVVRQIADYVNTYSDRSEEFNKEMSREHRTLQQSFTKLCFQWIEFIADEEYRTDGRNEASQKTAQLIIKLLSEHYEKQGYTGLTNAIMTPPSNHLPMV